ncbi:MAG TPA: hypothetical protein DIU15_00670 [Deltaproteobacteria bacterium]|nr:hypothetical protein [Deltaproteobacteria bacterium]HCP44542.1 hypothetical protein [Deltaproteobacteria bacterium]
MNPPLLGLCLAEWRKAKGRGLAYAVLLFAAAHGVLAALVLKGLDALQQKALASGALPSPALGPGAGPQDPFDLLVAGEAALHMAVFPVNGFALLLLAAMVWAEDFSLGTLAMLFVRPVSRGRVFLAKSIVLLAAAAMSIGIALCTALTLGAILSGFSAELEQLQTMPLVGWMASEPSMGARAARLISGWLAGTLLMAPALGLAALVAALTRSPVLTLFGTLLLLVGDFFVFLALSAWGKTSLESAELAGFWAGWTLWGSRSFFPLHGPATIVSQGLGSLCITLAYSILFFGLALWLFVRRDVT